MTGSPQPSTQRPKKQRSWLSRHRRARTVVYTLYALLAAPFVILPLPFFLLPKTVVYSIARRVGMCIAYPLTRKKTRANLFHAFGGRMTERRADALARKVAANTCYWLADVVYLWVFARWLRWDDIVVSSENQQAVFDSLAGGNGLIIATPHYGCFEIIAAYFLQKLRVLGGVIARSFPSPFMNWLYRKTRLIHDVTSFYDQVRDVMRFLKHNGVIGVLPDLRAKRRLGLPTTFFGKPTLTFDIHVRIAGHARSPIIPAFLMRHKRKPWQHTMVFREPIIVPPKSPDETIHAITQQINDVFEWHLRRYPSGWMWFNNKWRLW